MSENLLVVSCEGSETRVGLLENSVLVEYFVERERERGISGNIYRGRVSRVLPGMQAAFVDLGPTVERRGYLYVAEVLGGGDEKRLLKGYESSESKKDSKAKKSSSRPRTKKAAASRKIEELLKENQEVLVQIIKEPVGEKGARVTGYVSLPGRHCVFMPTLDKVGVSHRVSSDKERKRLRDIVDDARPSGAGFIVRTAAEGAEQQEVRDDVSFLLRVWEQIGGKQKKQKQPGLLYRDLDLVLRCIRDLLRDKTKQIVIDDEAQYQRAVKFTQAFMPSYVERIARYDGRRPIFEHYGIEEALRTALHRHVPLESGGSLVFDQGEALTAIDVNTGSFVGTDDLEDTITKNNLEACKAVAHQLRLRNLGGIIVVDFVDMDKAANRKQVWEEFNKALSIDRARSNVTKISELGLVEMTRKRTRESLHQLLTVPCPACEGKGVVKSPTTVAYDILREIRRIGATVTATEITIEAAPKVADLLRKYEREYLDELEKRFHKKVVIKGSKSIAPDQYKLAGKVFKDVEPAKKSKGSSRSRKRSSRSKSTRGKTQPTP